MVLTAPRNNALGSFLRGRRATVEPHHVGLPAAGRRRVPGLRREEVARIAGVSPDYYTRLEQGRQPTASPAVLDAVARALRLTDDERSHLYALAGVAQADPGGHDPTAAAGDRVRRVLAQLGDTPAMVVGPFVDVTATNPAVAFLFTDFATLPPGERNGLRWMLLAPRARELYRGGWEDAATDLIAMLRLDAGRYPDHPRLTELVGELGRRSALFRRVWTEQRVSRWQQERKILHHPRLGAMEFVNEMITVHGAPGRTLVMMIPADPPAFRTALQAAHREPVPATSPS